MKSEPTDVNTQRMPFAMLTKEDLLVRSFSDEILKITKFLKIDELDKFETERYTQYDWYFTGKNFVKGGLVTLQHIDPIETGWLR